MRAPTGIMIPALLAMAITLAGCGQEESRPTPRAPSVTSPPEMPDIDQIMQDPGMMRTVELTMAMNRDARMGNRLIVVTWQPPEYQQALMRNTPMPSEEFNQLPDEFRQMAEDALQEMSQRRGDQMMVMVTEMNMGSDDSAGSESLGDLQGRIRVCDPDGNIHTPLDPEQIDPNLRHWENILSGDMPDMSEMPFDLKSLRRNMQIFFFPHVADPTQEGTFAVLIDDLEFVWELPINALLPPMVNPETGQEFPGNYQFDPETGAELVPAER